jgi:AraC-like DNA-binding protein
VTPYRQFFEAPLRFDTEQYAVVFASDWLDRQLPDTSPELRRLLQTEVHKLDLQQGDSFSDQVRKLLRTAIVTGHSSADQIAELFSMHRRTLSRHLSSSNTNLKQLKDEIRFEIALQLLEDSNMDIVQIALILGYSNASAFTRAFRRWSATTPAKWRALEKVSG